MSKPDLRLGGLVIPETASLRLEQTYRKLERGTDQRTAAGSGVRWVLWGGKLATDIILEGFVPPGLATLSTSAAMVVSCAVPRAVDSASRVITIPSARRSGGIYEPYGLAEVAGRFVETAVTPAGDVMTLDEVVGADRYRVQYWPEFTSLVTIAEETLSNETGRFRYSITAEES